MPKKRHVLLINPWIEDFAAFDYWLRPNGLLKIATYLKNMGLNVSFIDCLERISPEIRTLIAAQKGRDWGDGRGNYYKTWLSKPSVLDFIPRNFGRYGVTTELLMRRLSLVDEPDLVCLSGTMTYWYTGLDSLIEIIHERWPRLPVILGGIYPSLLPEHARERMGRPLVFPGSGLQSFHDYVVEFFELDDHRFPHTSMNSDCLVPDYSLLDDPIYIAIETSQGCPFQCGYCASRLFHPTFRQFPQPLLMDQLIHCARNLSTRHVAFYDDALFINPEKHVKPLLRAIIEADLPLAFHTPNGLFPRLIDAELATLMFQAGLRSIRLSFDLRTALRSSQSDKVADPDLTRAFEYLEAAGYTRSDIEVYILAGLPDQDQDIIGHCLEYVASCRGISRLYHYSPIPGTSDWFELVRRGHLKHDTDPLLQNPTVFAYCNPNLSFSDFEQLRHYSLELNRSIIAEHYLNTG
ncbi:hypothetical protein JXQ70_03130 [bacterium]|nr:hypothetical protein [bacterium]